MAAGIERIKAVQTAFAELHEKLFAATDEMQWLKELLSQIGTKVPSLLAQTGHYDNAKMLKTMIGKIKDKTLEDMENKFSDVQGKNEHLADETKQLLKEFKQQLIA